MIDLKVFPRLQVLHADPRWTKLMGRMNLAP